MVDKRQKIARTLGWVGVVPFAVLAVTAHVGAPQPVQELLIGYVLVILAFMNGSLWAGALERPVETSAPLIASIVLVLAGLPALLMPVAAAGGWLAVLFALHMGAEWRWVHSGHPGWYRQLHLMISTAVVALLLIAALAGVGNG